MKNNYKSDTCNEKKFVAFFKEHIKPLKNFLYYRYGDADQADDVAQDTFIKLWEKCAEVPLEKAKSFIYTIAKNASLNIISHQKIVLEYEKTNKLNDKNYQNPEYLLEEEQFKQKLLTAIQKLNEAQRIAFLMNRIDGKKYAEIAEELNISVKAVEKRIHLALVELRKEFDNI